MLDKEVQQFFNQTDRQNPAAKSERGYFRLVISIAESILRMRKKAGLTQAQLATRMGTSRSSIALWETPVYTGYSLQKLYRVAEQLNHTLNIRFVPKVQPPNCIVRSTIGEGGWNLPIGPQVEAYTDNKREAQTTSIKLPASVQGGTL
jgi:transcriptional regulator with XRE-family HTH domain